MKDGAVCGIVLFQKRLQQPVRHQHPDPQPERPIRAAQPAAWSMPGGPGESQRQQRVQASLIAGTLKVSGNAIIQTVASITEQDAEHAGPVTALQSAGI